MQLPLAGVAQQRGRDLLALQHVLHAHQEIGAASPAARPRPRPPAPAGSAPSRGTTAAGSCGPAARTVRSLPGRRPAGRRRPAAAAGRCRPPAGACWSRTSRGSSPSYSTSSKASVSGGISRSKRISPSRARLRWRRSIRSQADGLRGQDLRRRPRRLLQALEQQQGARRDGGATAAWPAWPR